MHKQKGEKMSLNAKAIATCMEYATSGVFNTCFEETRKSTYKFKVGAVIFKGSRIISSAHNKLGYCSSVPQKYRQWRNSVHAELACVLKAKERNKLKGCSILVMKTSKTGSISNAKPCEYCQATLRFVGIKEVFYSNEDGEIVKLEDW